MTTQTPWEGAALPLRLVELGKLATGRPTWMRGVLAGCTCESENVTPCAACVTAAKTGIYPSPPLAAPDAEGTDMAGQQRFEIYEDAAGEHRWRVTARNGEIIGASSEGYVDRDDCARNATQLAAAIMQAIADEGIA